MLNYFWVMIGGALGTGARFWASGMIAGRVGEFFPLGTLTVNVTGSFIIGLFAALTDPRGSLLDDLPCSPVFMIGACGGYTTFSRSACKRFKAVANAVLLAACMFAVWLGRVCRPHNEMTNQ